MVKYSTAAKEQMRVHVEACAKSGASITSYCKAHAIKEHVFHYWKQVYGNKEAKKGSFVALSIPVSTSDDAVGVEILLPSGTQIRFSKMVSVEYIKTLCCI